LKRASDEVKQFSEESKRASSSAAKQTSQTTREFASKYSGERTPIEGDVPSLPGAKPMLRGKKAASAPASRSQTPPAPPLDEPQAPVAPEVDASLAAAPAKGTKAPKLGRAATRAVAPKAPAPKVTEPKIAAPKVAAPTVAAPKAEATEPKETTETTADAKPAKAPATPTEAVAAKAPAAPKAATPRKAAAPTVAAPAAAAPEKPKAAAKSTDAPKPPAAAKSTPKSKPAVAADRPPVSVVVADTPSIVDMPPVIVAPPVVAAPVLAAELPGVATPVEASDVVAAAPLAEPSLSSAKAPEPIPTIVVRPGIEFETAAPVTSTASATADTAAAAVSSAARGIETAPVVKAPRPVESAPPVSAVPVAAPVEAPAVTAAPVAAPVEVPAVAATLVAAPVEAPPSSAPVTPAAAPSAPAVIVPASGDTQQRDTERPLTVLMVTSEAVPFAKTGGLADVAGALPGALGRLGHDVTVVLPRYRGVAVTGEPIHTRVVQLGQDRHTIKIYEEPLGPHARAWLIDEPALYDRDGIYGTNGSGDHQDNPRRFALLARAALEGARGMGLAPDVVHAHDWQAGLAPVYLKTRFARDPVLGGVPSVFTIHNIAYQGVCDPGWLPALDLGWDLFRPEALEFWSKVSFLKAGIVFSEKITTVSPRYAQEILTPEFAFGFEGVLASRRTDLVGILNGIDAETWNPATDRFIPKTYTAGNLAPKREAKRALLAAYGFPADDESLKTPLIGQVSRMVDQKGLDLIAQIAHELPQLGARFVILGTGEPRYEEMWRSLARQYPDRISVKIGFDEPLSHVLEAGSDLFMMPSRFEPCGLNQMYSLRYGTLPIVRATGGLDDTVENYDPYTERGTGFKFWEASGPALLNTMRWALRVYENPEVWQRLQRAAMGGDWSWERSAREYAALYATVAKARRVAQGATATP
jgi:starch synthase